MFHRLPVRRSPGNDTPEPAGTLKVSMAPSFGVAHVVPLLPGFLARYPLIRAEWHFENRVVDLVGEGYDAAIGGAQSQPRADADFRGVDLAGLDGPHPPQRRRRRGN